MKRSIYIERLFWIGRREEKKMTTSTDISIFNCYTYNIILIVEEYENKNEHNVKTRARFECDRKVTNHLFFFFLIEEKTDYESKYKTRRTLFVFFIRITIDMNYTYLNEDQIDIELKCAICHEPFQLPMNCKLCGNTYCQECIIKWLNQQLSCPSCRQIGNHFLPVISRVVINQLNRLLVQCKLCQQIGIQRSNYKDHISCTCPKYIIQCTDQCGWKGCRENLQEHLIKCRTMKLTQWQTARRWIKIAFVILAIFLYFIIKK
jgi:hypothetical protein